MTRAADWLISKEVRRKGDWSIKRPDTEPSGWAFEFANEFYPDIDDTAMVLLGLMHAKASNPAAQAATERRAINWLLAMQSGDGGWAAFDVDNNWALLNQVPFADHNAMLDPTCPDITGRVLECLCRRGMTMEDEPIRRGAAYLLGAQERDGSWYGRWGVNYIYGSFLAMRGLAATGAPAAPAAIARAADWLRMIQNPDGGWGESCAGYDVDHFMPAPSCASQTAWGLLGLLASGDTESDALRRGMEYLIEHQREDGTWAEELTTGTGFPQVFYLTYCMYSHYFPLLALAACRRARKA
jgi:squalene-hopene/tetraprenyl-beta-curcumene cyclase